MDTQVANFKNNTINLHCFSGPCCTPETKDIFVGRGVEGRGKGKGREEHLVTLFNALNNLPGRCSYHPPFTERETEAQSGTVPCSGWSSQLRTPSLSFTSTCRGSARQSRSPSWVNCILSVLWGLVRSEFWDLKKEKNVQSPDLPFEKI